MSTTVTGKSSTETTNVLGIKNVEYLYANPPRELPFAENGKEFDGGIEFPVVANSFKITLKEEKITLYQYDIRFSPALREDSDRRIKIVDALKSQIEESLQDNHFIYDNMRLFSTVQRETFTLAYESVQVTFELNAQNIPLHEKDIKERLQIFQNFLIDLCAEVGIVRHDKKFIDFDDVRDLCSKNNKCPALQFTRGYRLAVNVSSEFGIIDKKWERTLTACLDPCNFIFQKNTVLTTMEEIRESPKVRGNPEKWKKQVMRDLVGEHITCEIYRSKKVFRIDDVDFNNTVETYMMRPAETSPEISLKQFYKTYYNYDCESSAKGILLHDVNRDNDLEQFYIPLPPETCRLTGFPRSIRRDIVSCRRISSSCKIDADIRYHLFEDLKEKLMAKAQELDHFLQIDEHFQCKGKLLDLAPIFINGKQRNISINELQGQVNRTTLYNMEQAKLKEKEWVIFYDVEKTKKKADKLGKAMMKEACAKDESGQRCLGKPLLVCVKDFKKGSEKGNWWVNAIDETIKENNGKLQALVFILPKENEQNKREVEQIYGRIKNACCNTYGIVSQCIQANNLATSHAVSGITRQMFVKRGAVPWKLRFYKCSPLFGKDKPTMLVGIDVHHDKKSHKSTIGFCSTWDRDFVRYYNEVKYQPEKEGVIRRPIMTELMTNGLYSFVEKNRRFPAQILIYRDGGADSQMDEMKNQEVSGIANAITMEAIQQLCCELDIPAPEELPQFMFIVIQKRVSSRFLYRENNHAFNVPPGTIIDNYVCSGQHWDWYMVPADAPQGCTASATRFVVIVDELGIGKKGAEHVLALEAFTKQLCNTYFNWAGPVRVPSVCKNADKLSQLYGSSILPQIESEPNVHRLLKDQLHFL